MKTLNITNHNKSIVDLSEFQSYIFGAPTFVVFLQRAFTTRIHNQPYEGLEESKFSHKLKIIFCDSASLFCEKYF